MENDAILYFVDAYLLMRHYGQTIESIVADFVAKERAALTEALKTQLAGLPADAATRRECLERIIKNSVTADMNAAALETLLAQTLAALRRAAG